MQETIFMLQANLAYIIATLAFSIENLVGSLIVALITRPIENIVLVAVNQNGLLMFLLVGFIDDGF